MPAVATVTMPGLKYGDLIMYLSWMADLIDANQFHDYLVSSRGVEPKQVSDNDAGHMVRSEAKELLKVLRQE